MPSTGPDDNESGYAGGSSRRRVLAAVAAGTFGATGGVAGRVAGVPGSDPRSTAGKIAETDGAGVARDDVDRSLAAGTWRRFQYDPRNTGLARVGGGPRSSPGVRWGYRDGDSFGSTPVVTEDTVYVADDGTGEVIAVDRSDGTERWRVEADVGDGRMTYDDGALFVPADDLEVRSSEDGSLKWSVDIGGPRSAVVLGGSAYVAAIDGAYRVNLETEAIDWHVDRVKRLARGLAVTSEYVYAAGRQYGRVIALDTGSGVHRWLRRRDGTARGAPTVGEKRVVVPTDEELVALGYESGIPKWTQEATVRSSVAIADGVVYATDEGEDVFALDLESGEEQWRRSAIRGSNPPVVVGGLLYVTGTDGSMAAITPSDGSTVWRETVGGERSANVAVAGGELYAVDHEGQMAAIASSASGGLRTPTPEDTPTPTAEGSTPADGETTATPTSGGAPGFGLLSGAVAAGAGALAALRLLSARDDEGK